jgi:spermidine synthase
VNALLWACFALSGASALGLELLWLRSAGLVLGTTAVTAATVVAGYFAGLAAGAWLARRAPDRPVRRYALLELAASGGAVLSWAAFYLLASDGAQRALNAVGPAGRVAVVALIVVPVTTALGATLPTLCQALAAPSLVGRRGGALYALNTLGGAVGVVTMGFGLPALIGVTGSYLAAATASALAGVVALVVGDSAEPSAPRSAATRLSPPREAWLVALGGGFVGMSLEILWVVLFAQVLHNSVYSFAAVTLVFLLALAIGAELSAVLLRRVEPVRLAAAGLLLAGVATIAGVWTFVYLTDGLRYIGMRTGLAEYVVRILGLVALTAGPATLASGVVLPALWAAVGERDSSARPVGGLTSANLVGGVGGAVAAGFLVLPWLGLRAGFLLAAVVSVVLAALLVDGDRRMRLLAYAGLLLAVVADPLRAPLTFLNPRETVQALRESPSGIVSVVDTGDDRQLRLDNYYVLGGSAAERNERRLGLVPLLLHPAPRRVAFIGMATGISASAATALKVDDLTVVEVVPEVAALARTHFGKWNAGLLDWPGVRLVVDDGRRYLAASDTRFDVIVSDLFIPWHATAGNLYSVDMYRTAARRLGDGGLFCQWLPLYQLTREEFEVIARTFLAAFPHVTLWRNDFYPNRPVLGLIGTRQPLRVDLDRIGQRLAGLPDWSRDSLLTAPLAIAMLYLGDLSLAPGLIPDGAVNRDEQPVIEFLAPRLTRMSATGDKDWLTGEALADYTEALTRKLTDHVELTLPATRAAVDARRAGLTLFRYALAATRDDTVQADVLMREVSRLVPDVVAGAAREGPAIGLADVRRTLGTLRSEQERLRQQLQSMEQRLRATPSTGERR